VASSYAFGRDPPRPALLSKGSGGVGGHAVPLRDFPTPVGSDEPFQAKSEFYCVIAQFVYCR
jgi:hypothetical protein